MTKCRKIQHLSIDKRHLIGILRSLQPIVFEQLKSIEIDKWTKRFRFREKDVVRLIHKESPLLFVSSYHDSNFTIEVKFGEFLFETSWESLDIVLKFTECWRRSVRLRVGVFMNARADPSLVRTQWPSVHTLDCSHGEMLSGDNFLMLQQCPQVVRLILKNCSFSPEGLSRLASIASQGRFSKLSTLDIRNSKYFVGRNREKLLCSSFPTLDTLLLNSCDLDSHDLSSLAHASVTGRLPKLTTLDISNNPDIGGNLSVLFCSTSFPTLHSLFVTKCKLNILDVSSLAEARERALPQLKHLDVSFNFSPHSSSHAKSNSSSDMLCMFPRLNSLIARACELEYNDLYHMYQRAFKDVDHFSGLTTLDMTLNPNISGSLSLLMCHYFPELNILVLRNCALNSNDMASLSQASSCGRLPELRHLDLSQNDIGWKKTLFKLFGDLKGFPSLINLMLCDCNLKPQDLCCLTQAKLDDNLPRIRHLDISLNGLSGHVGILSQHEISWGSVICYDE